MAKNIPITARVSRGLFGQKAKEPVLNVGPAGVYGNNITKGDPSPTKMMSPLKQVKTSKGTGDLMLEQGQGNVSTITPGEDKVIKGGKKTYVKPYSKNWDESKWGPYSEWIKKPGNKQKEENFVKSQTVTEDEPDKIEKGESKKSTQPLKVFNEGSAKTSYWRRQDDRAVTHTSRKKKKADIQLAKIEAEEKKLTGEEKTKYINEAKTKAKKEMWEARQSGYEGSRNNAILQSQQSARVHDKIIGVQVDPSKEQVLPVSRTQVGDATKYKMQGQMESQTFTGPESLTTSTSENANPLTGKPAGKMADTKSTDVKVAESTKTETPKTEAPKTEPKKFEKPKIEEDNELPTSPVERNAKGFFAKKSPLKMKYFK